jgi:hypothetical protein
VGRRISFVGPDGPWYEIAGVVGDTRDAGLDRPAPGMLYLSYAQRRDNWTWLSWQTLMVRADPGREPSGLLPSIRAALREIDPLLPLGTVKTIDEQYAELNARRRFATQLTAGFAGLALLLGAIGIYAVVAYSVVQRRQEIGIRLALGATRRSIAAAVVKRGLALAAGRDRGRGSHARPREPPLRRRSDRCANLRGDRGGPVVDRRARVVAPGAPRDDGGSGARPQDGMTVQRSVRKVIE